MNKFGLFFKGLALMLLCASTWVMAQTAFNRDQVMQFSKTLAYIKQYSVETTDNQHLLEGAMSGMLQSLDAHSTYLDEDAYKALSQSTKGEFAGLGIELTADKGHIKVITPIDGSPAAKAGIKAGDYIIKLNNLPTQNLTLDQAVKKMRGKRGTKITLTLVRQGQPKPFDLTLTREVIQVASVKSELLPNGFGYIRISQFGEKTAKNVRKAIASLEHSNQRQKLNGLILDLRNNPGGLLTAAITISDLFIDSEKANDYQDVIVSTKGRTPRANMTATASRGDILMGAPIIVLINEGSASASEIVSGALQDYHRAVIMGNKSFGKGSVQSILPLDKTHAIKLTTALYYTPAGRKIQAKGVKPDILVETLPVDKQQTEAVLLDPIKQANLTTKVKRNILSNYQYQQYNVKLAKKDYQLNQAISVLKALAIANHRITKQLNVALQH